ncbi:hypothetical protein B5807_03410 [Epicoccum nigrum]|uniref:Extracellular membrane protein CFEM domain-containing protein n=1 Tax=Epicoccum nigrum TaxID=105696 RepID=A0A1Y2M866_EPING|nr:hypothetical protein B5807_03410 [Epicoccum nigrum]
MLHQIRNLIVLGCLAASVVAVTGGNDKVNCNDCAKRIKDCEKECHAKPDESSLLPFGCETHCVCHTVLLDIKCRDHCHYDAAKTCDH